MDVIKLVLAAMLLTSCASQRKLVSERDLQRRLKVQERELQNLRDENKILKHKVSLGEVPTEANENKLNEIQLPVAPQPEVAAAPTPTPAAALPAPAPAPIVATAPAPKDPSGDHLLYAKVIESFRGDRKDDLFRATELLEKGYPESVHVDNALYLKGLYFFSHNQPADALKVFRSVRERYPEGNKVPASLFAEAMVLKKMSQKSQAEQLLKKVASLYPGSPESQRVELELRLLTE